MNEEIASGCIGGIPPERRQYVRVPVAVQIEMKCDGVDVPMRAETTDICLGGCYVEMAMTMAVGTKLGIVLWLDHEPITMKGRVVTQHSQFGNGIEFLAMTSDNESRLYRFLENQSTSPKRTQKQSLM